MWPGLGKDLRYQLELVKRMTALTRLTPTKEWPLVFVAEHDLLLVVREWPNGEITAYATDEYSDAIRRG